MTVHRDLKRIVRECQKKTGESYTAARAHVMRKRATLLGLEADAPTTTEPVRVDAVVLKVNQQSARVRILGEESQVTFRSGDIWDVAPVVPGHLVTLVIERRWTWRGDAYASGKIENPLIDVAKLRLEPLPLDGGELEDVGSYSEPCREPDPYAPLWKKLTARPRASFEFHGIAWGTLPHLPADENLTCDAAELVEAGDREGPPAFRRPGDICEVGSARFARLEGNALAGHASGGRIGRRRVRARSELSMRQVDHCRKEENACGCQPDGSLAGSCIHSNADGHDRCSNQEYARRAVLSE